MMNRCKNNSGLVYVWCSARKLHKDDLELKEHRQTFSSKCQSLLEIKNLAKEQEKTEMNQRQANARFSTQRF